MANAFIGEIRTFGITFAPQGWMDCDGRLLSIPSYAVLYSLLGTNFGGNGSTSFGLPDLRGRVALGVGQGPGLSSYTLGEQAGSETVTLNSGEIPSHTHTLSTDTEGFKQAPTAFSNSPSGASYPSHYLLLNSGGGTSNYSSFLATAPNPTTLDPRSLGVAGQNGPHENQQPYLTMRYCICVQGGDFPPRN